MKLIVALPTENKQICAHFGHCEEFAFVTTEGKFEVQRMEVDCKEEIEIWGTVTYIIKSVL